MRLVQGLGDEEIPSDRALTLCDALKTSDVIVTYAKFGNHVMDEEEVSLGCFFYLIVFPVIFSHSAVLGEWPVPIFVTA